MEPQEKGLNAAERDEDQCAAFRIEQATLEPNTLVVIDEASTLLARFFTNRAGFFQN